MNTETIFANWIAYENLSWNNENIEKFCYEIYNSDKTGKDIRKSAGWESKNIFVENVENNEIKTLTKIVNEKYNILTKKFGFCQNRKINIGNFWINIGKNNNNKRFHIHKKSVFVAVYYVKVPINSGKLILKNSNTDNYDMCVSSDMIEKYNEYNSSMYYYTPKQGDLVFFPAWLEHGVEFNYSNEDRISIAFNSIYEENYEN